MRYTKKVSKDGNRMYYRGNKRISKHEYEYSKSHKTKLAELSCEMKKQLLLKTDDTKDIEKLCQIDIEFLQLCKDKVVKKHINNLKVKELKEIYPDIDFTKYLYR